MLYNAFISAVVGPRRANIHTTMGKFNKMINLWCILFSITFAVGLIFYLTDDIDFFLDWTDYISLIILGGVCAGGVLILRMIFVSLSFALYFKGSGADEKESSYSSKASAKSSKSSTSSKKSKSKKKKNRDDEESLISKEGSKKSKSSKKSSKSSKSSKSRSKKLREKYNFDLEGGSSEDEYDFKKSKRSQPRDKSNPSRQQDSGIQKYSKESSRNNNDYS